MALRKPRNRLHSARELYLVGQCERQLIKYSLDMCVLLYISSDFMAHDGSRETLNYLIDYIIIT